MSITYLFPNSNAFLKDFCSKYEQIPKYLKICSHLLKKFLTENIIICAAYKANM